MSLDSPFHKQPVSKNPVGLTTVDLLPEKCVIEGESEPTDYRWNTLGWIGRSRTPETQVILSLKTSGNSASVALLTTLVGLKVRLQI